MSFHFPTSGKKTNYFKIVKATQKHFTQLTKWPSLIYYLQVITVSTVLSQQTSRFLIHRSRKRWCACANDCHGTKCACESDRPTEDGRSSSSQRETLVIMRMRQFSDVALGLFTTKGGHLSTYATCYWVRFPLSGGLVPQCEMSFNSWLCKS